MDRYSQPLNGQVVENPVLPGGATCTRWRPKIERFAQLAFTAINDPDIEDCMRQATISFTETGYPEEIIGRLRANQATGIRCLDLDGNRDAEAFVVDGDAEFVTFDIPALDNPNISDFQWAATLLHEVAHNRNYTHPVESNDNPNLPFNTTLEYRHSVNEQIKRCALEVLQGINPPSPHRWRLDTLQHETTMAPTGHANGAPYEISCPGGQAAFGVQLRTGALVDAIGLSCTAPGTGGILDTGLAGGGGGSHSFNDCPRDPSGNERLLVGLHGRSGNVHDRIGPLCSTAGDIMAGRPPITIEARPNVASGAPFIRRCPTGMIVRAIKGQAGALVDRVEVECQNLGRLEGLLERTLVRTGQPGPNTTIEKCAGRSALVGLTGQTGNLVDRLGGICSEVTTNCVGSDCTDDVAHINSHHFMTAHGGSGGQVRETISNATCGFGAVLVGLKMRAGDLIDQVAGVCAQAVEWGRNGGTPRTMPALGGGNGGGDIPAVLCPRTEFMVGWRISWGGHVNSIEPICRNFN
jgi:hypothetical protein